MWMRLMRLFISPKVMCFLNYVNLSKSHKAIFLERIMLHTINQLEKLREDLPEVIDGYLKTSTSRVFRIGR